MASKRVSADEARSKFKGSTKSVGKGEAVMKAAKAPATWDATSRSARFVMTSQSVDRYGDIVVTSGIDTTEFLRNPVGLLFHRSTTWPIGLWQNLESMTRTRPPRMEGDLVLAPEGAPGDLGECIGQAAFMIEGGFIRASSIGFLPDWDEVEGLTDDDGYWTGLQFNKTELVECSLCSIPANADALVKSAGGDLNLAKELLEDVLDNWARSPEGLLMPRKDYESAYATTTVKKTVVEVPVPTSKVERDAKVDEERENSLIERIIGRLLGRRKDLEPDLEPDVDPDDDEPGDDDDDVVEGETEKQTTMPTPEEIAAERAIAAESLARLKDMGIV